MLLLWLFAEQKQEGGFAGLRTLQMCQLFCGLQQYPLGAVLTTKLTKVRIRVLTLC